MEMDLARFARSVLGTKAADLVRPVLGTKVAGFAWERSRKLCLLGDFRRAMAGDSVMNVPTGLVNLQELEAVADFGRMDWRFVEIGWGKRGFEGFAAGF